MKFLLFPCFSKEKLKRVTRVMKRSVITINTFFLKNKKKKRKFVRSIPNSYEKIPNSLEFIFCQYFPFYFFFFIKYELKTMKKNVKNIYINSVHVPCIYMNSYFFLIKNKKKLTKNFA